MIEGRQVPCGKCAECRDSRRLNWFVRLLAEHRQSSGRSFFATLTYQEEPKNGVDIPTIQKLLKRVRKALKSKIRYYAVGEYGGRTGRAHYHVMFFGVPVDCDFVDILSKCWTFPRSDTPIGWVHIGTVNEASTMYITKYHTLSNPDKDVKGRNSEFQLMSKGIGLDYVENFRSWHQGDIDRAYFQYYEKRYPLPRYWKEKLYTEEERDMIYFKQQRGDYQLESLEVLEKLYPKGNAIKTYFDRKRAYQQKHLTKSNITQKL